MLQPRIADKVGARDSALLAVTEGEGARGARGEVGSSAARFIARRDTSPSHASRRGSLPLPTRCARAERGKSGAVGD